jgi:hypothetical protein
VEDVPNVADSKIPELAGLTEGLESLDPGLAENIAEVPSHIFSDSIVT